MYCNIVKAESSQQSTGSSCFRFFNEFLSVYAIFANLVEMFLVKRSNKFVHGMHYYESLVFHEFFIVHIFEFFLKTICHIHFKLVGDVPRVSVYQLCANGHSPVIFGFVMSFFVPVLV